MTFQSSRFATATSQFRPFAASFQLPNFGHSFIGFRHSVRALSHDEWSSANTEDRLYLFSYCDRRLGILACQCCAEVREGAHLGEAAAALTGGAAAVRGRLRVEMDPFFSRLVFAPQVNLFLSRYPDRRAMLAVSSA